MWSTVNRQPSTDKIIEQHVCSAKNQRDGKNHPSDFERKTGLELALRASIFSAISFFTPPNPLAGGTQGPRVVNSLYPKIRGMAKTTPLILSGKRDSNSRYARVFFPRFPFSHPLTPWQGAHKGRGL